MSNKVIRKFYKDKGFSIKNDVCLMEYTSLTFDVAKSGDTKLALHWVEDGDFSKRMSTLELISKNIKEKICIFFPSSSIISAKDIARAKMANFDLYSVDGRNIQLLAVGDNRQELDKALIKTVKDLIKNINQIFYIKYNFKLFNQDNSKLIDKLKSLINTETECIYQIAAISSIFELINSADLKKYLVSPKDNDEKNAFKNNHTLKILKIFIARELTPKDSLIIANFQNLRSLRNISPIHQSSKEAKKACKDLIGLMPRDDSDWKRLGEISVERFIEKLTQLRNIFK